MNLPEIESTERKAIEIVVTNINATKEKLGVRQNLAQLANTAGAVWGSLKVPLKNVSPPFRRTAEQFLMKTIENEWKLKDVFKYHLKLVSDSDISDDSRVYYFEAIFSQPTVSYPIPQVTVSVYFKAQIQVVGNKGYEPRLSMVWFRIEGHSTEHDIRYIMLPADWLRAVLQMKLKLFKRLQELNLF